MSEININIWIDKHGDEIALDKIDTQYLYHIVKMIFNNVISPREPFGDVIYWRFNPRTHPHDYLLLFFENGMMELYTRKDNKIAQEFINHIDSVIKTNKKLLLTSLQKDIDSWMADEHICFNENDFGDRD